MKKLFVLVALVGMLALGWPATPVNAELRTVNDPNDQTIAQGDILTATVIHEYTVTVRVTVEGPAENPTTDENWKGTNSETFISWLLNTDGDADPEFDVEFFAETDGSLSGPVFAGEEEEPVCEGDAAFVSNGYQVTFPRTCIGSPDSLKFNAALTYDPTPAEAGGTDLQVDEAPDAGAYSAGIAGPPAVDREVRAGVVGQGDNALYQGHGFGGQYDGLGGQLLAAPAVTRIAKADAAEVAIPLYVGTGTDNQLWARTDTMGWRRLSSSGSFCKGTPGALVFSPSAGVQTLIAACRGGDDALYRASGTITTTTIPDLNNWTRLGGKLGAGPSIGIDQGTPQKLVTYLVPGPDGRVYRNQGAVGGFAAMPWICKGHVAFNTLNTTSWFGCRGTDDALWAAENTADGWGNVFSLGGKLNDGPGVAVTGGSAVFFVQGTDNVVYQTVVEHGSHDRTPYAFNGGRIKFGVGATAL